MDTKGRQAGDKGSGGGNSSMQFQFGVMWDNAGADVFADELALFLADKPITMRWAIARAVEAAPIIHKKESEE